MHNCVLHNHLLHHNITYVQSLMPELKYEQRLSGHGYAILSRVQPKLFQLSETTVLGSTGCWCDILTFCKVHTFFYLQLGLGDL